jgi:molybdenum cofactor cytidylyltransferase
MINAIILAAGESKRMGMPKPLLRFPRSMGVPPMDSESRARCPCYVSGDTTFLEQIVSVLQRSEVDRITAVLGAHAQKVLAATDLAGAGVVINENYGEGQLSSLIAGLKSVPPEAEAILLCLVDNPFITAESADGVIGAFRVSGKPIVVPVFQGQRGHPTLFARSMFNELLTAPADKGARYVVQSNVGRVFEVRVSDPGVLVRIDTPQDYLSHFGVAPRIIER